MKIYLGENAFLKFLAKPRYIPNYYIYKGYRGARDSLLAVHSRNKTQNLVLYGNNKTLADGTGKI